SDLPTRESWGADSYPHRGRPERRSSDKSGRFRWHFGALLPSVALERMTVERLMRSQAEAAAATLRSAANLLEQMPGNGDLGHLEGDTAATADDLGADLDQLLLQVTGHPGNVGLREHGRGRRGTRHSPVRTNFVILGSPPMNRLDVIERETKSRGAIPPKCDVIGHACRGAGGNGQAL